jgi:hypothetical protein
MNHKTHIMVLIINLGFVLFHTTNDNEMMKKKIDFVKIKFHLNENIE